jgi:hypothetical protein
VDRAVRTGPSAGAFEDDPRTEPPTGIDHGTMRPSTSTEPCPGALRAAGPLGDLPGPTEGATG